jgi:hypothetical protein
MPSYDETAIAYLAMRTLLVANATLLGLLGANVLGQPPIFFQTAPEAALKALSATGGAYLIGQVQGIAQDTQTMDLRDVWVAVPWLWKIYTLGTNPATWSPIAFQLKATLHRQSVAVANGEMRLCRHEGNTPLGGPDLIGNAAYYATGSRFLLFVGLN